MDEKWIDFDQHRFALDEELCELYRGCAQGARFVRREARHKAPDGGNDCIVLRADGLRVDGVFRQRLDFHAAGFRHDHANPARGGVYQEADVRLFDVLHLLLDPDARDTLAFYGLTEHLPRQRSDFFARRSLFDNACLTTAARCDLTLDDPRPIEVDVERVS